MITRLTKILLVAGIGLFHALVVFNNLTDFDPNYQFVRHVLSMDTTPIGNLAMYRALTHPAWHLAFYFVIIAWEMAAAVLLLWGANNLLRATRLQSLKFNSAKHIAIMGITLSMLLWLIAFIDVGGEWFLMWQSRVWNGQEAAFRNFAIMGIVLVVLMQPDTDLQP
jgi:predicted small integral membrane protein